MLFSFFACAEQWRADATMDYLSQARNYTTSFGVESSCPKSLGIYMVFDNDDEKTYEFMWFLRSQHIFRLRYTYVGVYGSLFKHKNVSFQILRFIIFYCSRFPSVQRFFISFLLLVYALIGVTRRQMALKRR